MRAQELRRLLDKVDDDAIILVRSPSNSLAELAHSVTGMSFEVHTKPQMSRLVLEVTASALMRVRGQR